MVCLACGELSRRAVCRACGATMAPAPDAHIGSLLVRSAFTHDAAAKRLVHRLKYDGVLAVAGVLAGPMVDAIPTGATMLVPVPRSLHRQLRYGIDTGVELALALSRATGLPMVRALAPELLHRPNAGKTPSARRAPSFRHRRTTRDGVVLVDDVFTTGITLVSAAGTLGSTVIGAVTATRAV